MKIFFLAGLSLLAAACANPSETKSVASYQCGTEPVSYTHLVSSQLKDLDDIILQQVTLTLQTAFFSAFLAA